jgi:hypothetical protein
MNLKFKNICLTFVTAEDKNEETFYGYLYLRNMSQRVRVGVSFRKDCNAARMCNTETAPSEFNSCIAQY